MSDRVYIERARKRQRLMLLGGLVLLIIMCGFFSIRNAFFDRCTNSFNRDPQAVVENYLQAISSGDAARAQNCWEHNTYFEFSAGCSEICLSRVMGNGMQANSVRLSQARVEENRSRIDAAVEAVCPDGSPVSGTLLLDSVASSLPWKHYRVIQSDVGGSASQPWCK